MLKKILLKLHWLVGISMGLVLLVMGLTGAILSFQDPISNAINSTQTTINGASNSELPPADTVLSRVRQQTTQVPTQLISYRDPTLMWEIGFADGKRTQWFDLNPYDLTLKAQQRSGEEFFEWVEDLHRHLLLGDHGKTLTGIATITLIYLALSGLYLRWPRQRIDWKQWLTWDTRLKGRGFWRQLHVALGTWVFMLYLLIGLTGLFWSYDWYRERLFQLTAADRPAPRAPAPSDITTTPASRFSAENYAQITQQIAVNIPHYTRLQWRLPLQDNQAIEIRYLTGDDAHPRATNMMQLDAQQFTLIKHERYDELSVGNKIMRSIFVIHSGQILSWPGMLAMFIAALSLPVFFFSGWWLYIKRRQRRA